MRFARALTAALLIGLAILPAAALAWRPPSAAETRAITKAAELTPHAGKSKVHVGQIHVSTAGPWASAGVAIYIDGYPDDAIAVLERTHGRWVEKGVGTSGEGCGMPKADQRSLDLPCEGS
jgi:hypothetical protein